MSHTKSLLLFFTTLFSLTSLVYSDLLVKKPSPPPLKPLAKPPPPVKPPSTQYKPPPPPFLKPPTPPVPAVKPISPPPKPPTPPKPPSPPVKPPQSPVIPWIRTVKDCAPLCEFRCSSHSRPNVCIRACTTCCFRCKCVPPGTYGNREKCGKCYTSMTTHGNRPKCP